MSDITVQMQIAMAEAKSRIKEEDTIEDRFRAAAKVTRGHWLCTNEDERFRAAVGAVMLSYGPGTPEFERIAAEMRSIQILNAILTSAAVGATVRIPDELPEHDPLRLLDLWREQA